MKLLFLLAALIALPATADVVISSSPQVIVEIQPNNVFGQPLPRICRGTFNYTTGQVTIEGRPRTPPGTDVFCAKAWFGNLSAFWDWLTSIKEEKQS